MMDHLKRSRAQAMVEFALVLPLAGLLIGVLIEGCVLVATAATVANAARAAAHIGSFVAATDTQILAAANTKTPLLHTLPCSAVVVTPRGSGGCPSGSGRVAGSTVTVTVNYTYRVMLLGALGTTIPLTATAIKQVE